VSASSGLVIVDTPLSDNSAAGVERTGVIEEPVRVESVELVMNVETPSIGDLEIFLTSPDGTVSVLSRDRFDSQDDLDNIVFTSMKHWGERSEGAWTVKVAGRRPTNNATWQDFEIRVHGVGLGDPPCSPADFAEPFGVLDLADLVAFAQAYTVNDPATDLAEPFGVWDLADITEFVMLFTAGCP